MLYSLYNDHHSPFICFAISKTPSFQAPHLNATAIHDLADLVNHRLTIVFNILDRLIDVLRADEHDHADPVIESPSHLQRFHPTVFHQELEHWG